VADFIELKLDGRALDEVAKRLRSLAPQMRQKILDKAVRSAVAVWARDAKRRVVRSSVPHVVRFKGGRERHLVQPGNLARQISIRKLRTGKYAYSNESAYGIAIRRLGYYWRWVELGKTGISPKPFLKPAFDANVRGSFDVVATAAAKFIAQHLKA
jgi:hypothetical protein